MFRRTIDDALAVLDAKAEPYSRLLEKADFDVGLYRPMGSDDQSPHTRDELYIIASGTGDFFCAGETKPFAIGDFFLAPKGVEHRFENFSDDFATWVIFIGARP